MNRWTNILNPQIEYGCWIIVLTAELAWTDQLTPIAYNCLYEDSCYFVRLPCNIYACKLCTVPIRRTVSDTSHDGYRKLHKHQSILKKLFQKEKENGGSLYLKKNIWQKLLNLPSFNIIKRRQSKSQSLLRVRTTSASGLWNQLGMNV